MKQKIGALMKEREKSEILIKKVRKPNANCTRAQGCCLSGELTRCLNNLTFGAG